MIKAVTGYSFDDLLLIPRYSAVLPREVDVSTKIGHVLLKTPILSSAMDTVTETAMARAMDDLGGLGVIHKNMTPFNQSDIVKTLRDIHGLKNVAIAVGPSVDVWERLELCTEAGATVVVIDTAHGHSKSVYTLVEETRKRYPYITIIAGNVASGEGASALADAGASAIKCGVGGGSICTTRVVSGCGMPQLTAINECAEAVRNYDVQIIADGGIRYSGDITKALAMGADAVMVGGMLAGCDESPGETREIDGKLYKKYRGMGSLDAMEKGSKDRYGQQNVAKDKLVPEGVSGWVPSKGPVAETIHQLVGGLRSGMGYVGAASIHELWARARWATVTSAGQKESHVHSLSYVEKTVNYG